MASKSVTMYSCDRCMVAIGTDKNQVLPGAPFSEFEHLCSDCFEVHHAGTHAGPSPIEIDMTGRNLILDGLNVLASNLEKAGNAGPHHVKFQSVKKLRGMFHEHERRKIMII